MLWQPLDNCTSFDNRRKKKFDKVGKVLFFFLLSSLTFTSSNNKVKKKLIAGNLKIKVKNIEN